ncbi:MAG: SHOCT domain-containing protein [Rhizobacter sp.]
MAPDPRSDAAPPPIDALIAQLARDHGFTPDAVAALWAAVVRGGGAMAQFSHPELGGHGQWMGHGMVMVGDMFNRPLAARVDALCERLAALHAVHREPVDREDRGTGAPWWPAGLTQPAATGAQNEMRYAWFPAQRRLAIEQGGRVALYDTAHHVIGGVEQQQGAQRTVRFTSQDGTVDLDRLRRVDAPPLEAPAGGAVDAQADPQARAGTTAHLPDPASVDATRSAGAPPSGPVRTTAAPARPDREPLAAEARAADGLASAAQAHAALTPDQILDTIARLGALQELGVLTHDEFEHKKAELLARL